MAGSPQPGAPEGREDVLQRESRIKHITLTATALPRVKSNLAFYIVTRRKAAVSSPPPFLSPAIKHDKFGLSVFGELRAYYVLTYLARGQGLARALPPKIIYLAVAGLSQTVSPCHQDSDPQEAFDLEWKGLCTYAHAQGLNSDHRLKQQQRN